LDGALHHTGDDRSGDTDGDDGLDNEIITVNLQRVNPNVTQIFFFLNNCGSEDFSQIPYASIRMFEGKPDKVDKVFAAYNVSADAAYKGMTALVMGELYKHNDAWKFNAIGDAFPHPNLGVTIQHISKQYIRR
jgi:tellurium resistance protein TerZ